MLHLINNFFLCFYLILLSAAPARGHGKRGLLTGPIHADILPCPDLRILIPNCYDKTPQTRQRVTANRAASYRRVKAPGLIYAVQNARKRKEKRRKKKRQEKSKQEALTWLTRVSGQNTI